MSKSTNEGDQNESNPQINQSRSKQLRRSDPYGSCQKTRLARTPKAGGAPLTQPYHYRRLGAE